jgi:hypothetical protein
MEGIASFRDDTFDPAVRGFLHSPQIPNNHALILTHGAGSNCNAPLLVALAETFCGHGYTVLRCDLPFRQQRPTGPPFPGQADRDRAGLRNAVAAMRKTVGKDSTVKIFLGGHSYGGRQSTILCAAEPVDRSAGDSPAVAGATRPRVSDITVSALLLLSYPLHPPRKPNQLRIEHLPNLRTPSLFVHGTRDPFGSIAEIKEALKLIPAKNELLEVEGAGHDLGFKVKQHASELPARIFARFDEMFGLIER